MRIGLIDIDSHAKIKKWGATVYPNLALCKISAYHKTNGDDVEWYGPLHQGHFDKVYISKIFNWTPDYPYFIDADCVEYGGTGYDISKQLAKEIDDCQPDYSIYPTVPSGISYGFLTRGCPNHCKWCVVPKKEGSVKPYWNIERVANGNKTIILMDNNILAAGDYAIEQMTEIIKKKYRIDFNQALDARLVTEENAKLLAQIRWIKSRIRFGCDTPQQVKDCQRAMDMINDAGFNGEYFLYTMLDDLNESYERINYWKTQLQLHRNGQGGYKVYAYAQPFRDPLKPNKIPQWQKYMANWTNKKGHFWSVNFKDFEPRKGLKCEIYFQNNQ